MKLMIDKKELIDGAMALIAMIIFSGVFALALTGGF